MLESILQLKSHYRSGKSNLGKDFFEPCLSQCKHYKRAVGFFSSSALITWASALPRFVANQKLSIQLLVSPHINPQDREALLSISSQEEREAFLQKMSDNIVLDALEFAKGNQTLELRMKLFTWLVASKRLELRFAYPKHISESGIFHEKIGIFIFEKDLKVAFTGSANESEMGHSKNYESIDVFRSWIPADQERVMTKEEEFNEAWNGIAAGLTVKKLSKRVIEKISTYHPEDFDWAKYAANSTLLERQDKYILNKWKHQDEAVRIFLEKKHGVLEMATGTGKTRTALRIFHELLVSEKINTTIISMDGNDLLDQWYLNLAEEIRKLPNEIKEKLILLRHYKNYKELDYFIMNPRNKVLIISRPELHFALKRFPPEIRKNTLLVHDEVHRLGSPANRRDLKGLTENISYKLGLSATPEREYDEEGNAFIQEQIGPTIFKFPLEEAIQRGILCPFNYFPIHYELTEDDRIKIKQIWSRFETLKDSDHPMTQEELWIQLANVYKTSEAKIPLFKQFISTHPEMLNRCIIFVATQEYGQKILEIIHKYNPNFHTYFSGEDSNTLKRFADGELECLITCHRLSEGIDIRSLQNVILFSSDRAKLELIQRIGRCLRTDPTNPDKIANVIDFVRISNTPVSNEEFITADEQRKNWLTNLSKIRPEV